MPHETALTHDSHGERRSRAIDGEIAVVAERQHGVIARSQMTHLSRGEIEHRLLRRRLHPVHRGVYAVGHRLLSAEGRWMAAVLAVGGGTVLSHRSAADLWGIRSGDRAQTDVTSGRKVSSRPTILVHQCRLQLDEVTIKRGVPSTTPPRTLIDLAQVLPYYQVERAFRQLEQRGLTDRLSLPDLVVRYPRRRGMRTIKALLADASVGATATVGELEDRFLEFLDQARIARPEVNVWLGQIRVDFLWRAARVIVELDGHATHGTRHSFESDRARDRSLQAQGWRVVRVTWRQLHLQPEALTRDLKLLLR